MTPQLSEAWLDLIANPTADAVAAHLLAYGCTGRTHDSARDPIAVYLERIGGAPTAFSDYDSAVAIYGDDDHVQLPYPPAVQDFIVRLEEGEYPALSGAHVQQVEQPAQPASEAA